MNISNQDLKKKNDQIPPWSGEGPPTVFSLGCFSPHAILSIGRGRTGQADPAEPHAEQTGFHIVRSDQTSLTSVML